MFRNYLKVAIRALWRYKMFSVINVLVFTLGMTLCLLISLMMHDQSSYGTFHANKERIYRVISDVTEEDRARSFAISPAPMALVLLEEAPAILDVALLRLDFDGLGDLRPENMDIKLNGFYADPGFFQSVQFSSGIWGSGHGLGSAFLSGALK